jgi:hypothetical protein
MQPNNNTIRLKTTTKVEQSLLAKELICRLLEGFHPSLPDVAMYDATPSTVSICQGSDILLIRPTYFQG